MMLLRLQFHLVPQIAQKLHVTLKSFFISLCYIISWECVQFLLQFSIACWKLDGKLYVMQMTTFQTEHDKSDIFQNGRMSVN